LLQKLTEGKIHGKTSISKDQITEIDVENIIKEMEDSKAPGPSGITPKHLKFLSGLQNFNKFLA